MTLKQQIILGKKNNSQAFAKCCRNFELSVLVIILKLDNIMSRLILGLIFRSPGTIMWSLWGKEFKHTDKICLRICPFWQEIKKKKKKSNHIISLCDWLQTNELIWICGLIHSGYFIYLLNIIYSNLHIVYELTKCKIVFPTEIIPNKTKSTLSKRCFFHVPL